MGVKWITFKKPIRGENEQLCYENDDMNFFMLNTLTHCKTKHTHRQVTYKV